MKDVKYCFEHFAFYDQATIQERLEAMALAGWMIDKPGNVLWQYRRMEPKKLHFAVTYFSDASDFDPYPTEKQRMMEEFAQKDGWQLAARWGQMQIFSNEGDDPTPIETDAVVQVDMVHRAMKKDRLLAYLSILAICIFQLLFGAGRFLLNPVDYLSTPSYFYQIPAVLLLAVAVIIELFSYLRWYKKAKEMAMGNGIFLEMRRNRIASLILGFLGILMCVLAFCGSALNSWAVLLWLATLVLIMLGINGTKTLMKRKGFSRTINRLLSYILLVLLVFVLIAGTLVSIIHFGLGNGRTPVDTYEYDGEFFNIYDDSLPLVVEDLTDVNGQWSKEARIQETLILSNAEYFQHSLLTESSDTPSIEYTITDIKLPLLYDVCKQDMLETGQYEAFVPVDGTTWNATEVYQLYWHDSARNTYLICWEKRIVEITFYWAPTPEQIAVVVEKLGD